MTASTMRIATITPPTRSVRRSRGESERSEEERSSARAMSGPRRHLDAALVSRAGRIARDQVRLPALLAQLTAQAVQRLDARCRCFELERAVPEGQCFEHG